MSSTWHSQTRLNRQPNEYDNRQMSTITVKCPHCGKTVTWTPENSYRPFCSERCKLIDLGEWASETRVITGTPLTEDDLEEIEGELDQILNVPDRRFD